MGRVLHLGPSWHGTSFIWAELAWAELVLGRVVLHPQKHILCVKKVFWDGLEVVWGGFGCFHGPVTKTHVSSRIHVTVRPFHHD